MYRDLYVDGNWPEECEVSEDGDPNWPECGDHNNPEIPGDPAWIEPEGHGHR